MKKICTICHPDRIENAREQEIINNWQKSLFDANTSYDTERAKWLLNDFIKYIKLQKGK